MIHTLVDSMFAFLHVIIPITKTFSIVKMYTTKNSVSVLSACAGSWYVLLSVDLCRNTKPKLEDLVLIIKTLQENYLGNSLFSLLPWPSKIYSTMTKL